VIWWIEVKGNEWQFDFGNKELQELFGRYDFDSEEYCSVDRDYDSVDHRSVNYDYDSVEHCSVDHDTVEYYKNYSVDHDYDSVEHCF